MGLENKAEQIPPPAVGEQPRIPFGQRMLDNAINAVGRYTPHSWRLLAATGLVMIGPALGRATPASADTPNNPLPEVSKQAIPLDYEVPLPPSPPFDGIRRHFYRQTNGMGDNPELNTDPRGYMVSGAMLQTFENVGGVEVWGYPVSQEIPDDGVGRKEQNLQKGALQIRVDAKGQLTSIEYRNIFDEVENLRKAAKMNLDNEVEMIPPYANWSSDQGKPWGHTQQEAGTGTVEENHLKTILETVVEGDGFTKDELVLFKQKYLSNPQWFEQYGLPMGRKVYKNGVKAIVCQRVVLHLWPNATPWSKVGEVVVVNGGDVAKRNKLIAQAYIQPTLNPFGTGGGNGSVNGNGTTNGTEIIIPQLPYPLEIGEFQKDGIVVHNKGATRGLVLNIPDYFQNYLGRIAKRFFPQGVEYSISDLSITDYGKLLDAIWSNPNYEKKLSVATGWNRLNAAYQNSTMYGTINKTTGRLEIYINLPILSGKPTQENPPMPDVNIMISGTLEDGITLAAGGPFGGPFYYDDPQIQEWRRSVTTPGPVFVLVSKG